MDIWAAKAAACWGERPGRAALAKWEGPGGGPSGHVAPAMKGHALSSPEDAHYQQNEDKMEPRNKDSTKLTWHDPESRKWQFALR